MEQEDVKAMICRVRQVNGMLQILDAEKNNCSITLGEIHDKFMSKYGENPASAEFAFYNQHQFLTSLLAYLCLPSERFYSEIPQLSISSLPPRWGVQSLSFSGSLQELVRHLRNAVSHGHISVSPNLDFEFKNHDKSIQFNHVSLHQFCQALAYWCITRDVLLGKL